MPRISLDKQALAELARLQQPVEIRDEAGRFVGTFIPVQALNALWNPPLAEEEIKRRESSSNVLSTQQVKQRLESL
ncbi:MAG TPA: hypothetical protein PKD86_09495 [Gemmatales bacterium]|nr:hypothetical protein [Gemmatales bacterium]HMP59574.1 hypothetical protein [Gemmatales bacterium]